MQKGFSKDVIYPVSFSNVIRTVRASSFGAAITSHSSLPHSLADHTSPETFQLTSGRCQKRCAASTASCSVRTEWAAMAVWVSGTRRT